MNFGNIFNGSGRAPKLSRWFLPRELFIHDGAAMRRIHVSARTQMTAASVGALAFVFAITGVAQLAIGTPALAGALSDYASHRAEVAAMASRVESLQGEVAAIRSTARQHVAKIEARQAFLAAMMTGENPSNAVALQAKAAGVSADPQIAAMLTPFESEQAAMAGKVRAATDARYASTLAMVQKLGFSPVRLTRGGGMGGPYEAVPEGAAAQPAKVAVADPQFRALFNSWNRLDRLQNAIVSIPSARPVDAISVNSGFGVRSDPFRGGRAMHAGVDMPGPHGTKIYATADGRVGRTGWHGGYGNLVELEHGKSIQTRYGHLSSILVPPGARVKRGQLIALMGSTGRSTGNHLHYEVRIDGRAVNPIPFLQTSDYLLAMQNRPATVAVGGPVEKSLK